jgi:hypothetical protein
VARSRRLTRRSRGYCTTETQRNEGKTPFRIKASRNFVFVLQREVFKHSDEDAGPREDKIIHKKDTKATKTEQSPLSMTMICLSGLCDLVVNYFVLVAFVSLL